MARSKVRGIDVRDHQFQVALSFAGAYREVTQLVYRSLCRELDDGDVFYDSAFQLAYLDLVSVLNNIYLDATYVVAFVGAGYDASTWCGAEWDAIRRRIELRDQNVILVRLDDAAVLPDINWAEDGHIDARDQEARVAARRIAAAVKQRIRAASVRRHSKRKRSTASGGHTSYKMGAPAIMPSSPKRVRAVIFDAGGQWQTALMAMKRHAPVDDLQVITWPLDEMRKMHPMSLTSGKVELLPHAGFDPATWLYVFVAPVTVAAARRADYELKILGPAFSTDADVMAFVRATDPNSNRVIPAIGVIQDDITSAVMLRMLFSLRGNFFSHPRSARLAAEGANYEARDHPEADARLKALAIEGPAGLDGCIFTRREYEALRRSGSVRLVGHRPVMQVDPPVADYLQLDHVPRSVYFIQQSQFTDQHYGPFRDWFHQAISRTRALPLAGNVKVLSPTAAQERVAQETIVDTGRVSQQLSCAPIDFVAASDVFTQ